MNIRLPSGRRESLMYLTYYYSYVHITITYTKYTIMVKEQITIPKASFVFEFKKQVPPFNVINSINIWD